MATIQPYLKRQEALILGPETTRGTASSTQYTYRWLDKTLRTIPGILENESGVGNDYRRNDSAIDVNHSEGNIGGKVTEDGIGYLNLAMLNKVTTTAVEDGGSPTGYYKHHLEYDGNAATRSFSVWDVRPSTTRLYKAVEFDNLELSVEAGENGAWLETTAAVKGWKHEDVTGVTPALDTTEKEFTSRHVKVYLADDEAGLADETNSRIKPRSIKLTMEQTKTVDHSVGDGDTPELDKGPFEAKGEMVVKYRSTDLEEDYFANKIHAMKIAVINGDSSIVYTATKVRFTELTPSDDRDQVVTQQISFYCESDATNSGHAVVCDVTNTQATLV